MFVYSVQGRVLCEHVAHVKGGKGGICEYSRVSLGNEDDYSALGGGEKRQRLQGGWGKENMCL